MGRPSKYNIESKGNEEAQYRWSLLVDSEVAKASFLVTNNRKFIFIGKLRNDMQQSMDTAHSLKLRKSNINEFCDELRAIANEYLED